LSLSKAVFEAFVTGLIAYVGYLLVVLLSVAVVVVGLRKRFTWFWPQVRLGPGYPWAFGLVAGLVFLAALALPHLRSWELALFTLVLPWVLILQGYALLARTPLHQDRLRRVAFVLGLAAQGVLAFLGYWGAVRAGAAVPQLAIAALFAIVATGQVVLSRALADPPEDSSTSRQVLRPPNLLRGLSALGRRVGLPPRGSLLSVEERSGAGGEKTGPAEARNWRRWFVATYATALLLIAGLPAVELFDRAFSIETARVLRDGMDRASWAFERRAAAISNDYQKLAPRAARGDTRQLLQHPWNVAGRAGAPGYVGPSPPLRPRTEPQAVHWSLRDWSAPPWLRCLEGSRAEWWFQVAQTVLGKQTGSPATNSGCGSDLLVRRTDPAGRELRLSLAQTGPVHTWMPGLAQLYVVWGESEHPGIALVGLALLIGTAAILLLLLCAFLARRLLWIDLTWPRRFRPERGESFNAEEMLGVPRLVLSRVSGWMGTERPVDRTWKPVEDREVLDLLKGATIRADARDQEALGQIRGVKGGVVVMENLDEGVVRRSGVQLLGLLEDLLKRREVDLLVTCSTSPLFLLVRPDAYPGSESSGSVDQLLAYRWAGVFTQLRKHWLRPVPEPRPADSAGAGRATKAIWNETEVLWPRFIGLRRELMALARKPSPPHVEEAVEEHNRGAKLVKECLTSADVVDYVLRHGEAEFRRKWSILTRDERLMLYQLAHHRLPNAAGAEVLEHLLERGLAVCDPSPRIASMALARFVRRAEAEGVLDREMTKAARGTWTSIRAPLFLVVLLGLAWLAYAASDTFNLLYAVLVGALGFATNLLQAAGYLRGGGAGGPKGPG
jgi:hypothetical protein